MMVGGRLLAGGLMADDDPSTARRPLWQWAVRVDPVEVRKRYRSSSYCHQQDRATAAFGRLALETMPHPTAEAAGL